jgi:signal peptidase I
VRGDRILVQKLAYRAGDPRRWDVAVFKYPGDTKTNFVKRIVGLPQETVRIRGGDVFVRAGAAGDFAIARKPPWKARAMLLLVHDNDYQPSQALELGWPTRWQPDDPDSSGAWQTSSDYRSFETEGSAQGETWLRYRHVVPLPGDWEQLEQGRLPPGEPRAPRLVSDFYAGNTDCYTSSLGYELDPASGYVSPHWVGDLAVQCTIDVRGDGGEAVLELVEGGRRMHCRIDVADGSARLSIDGLESFRPAASTPVRGPGQYDLLFANVDDQLLLWVDGALVEFASPTTYDPLENTRPKPADLSPAGIASHGAALSISDVKLLRDVYYIAVGGRDIGMAGFGPLSDFDQSSFPGGWPTAEGVTRFLSDPDAWDAFDERRSVEFPLGPDQFFVLGDNSAESKDSRLWPMEGFPYYVSRDLLVGKVVYRYYPRWETVR